MYMDIVVWCVVEYCLYEVDVVWKMVLECSGDGVWDWYVQWGVEYFLECYLCLYGFELGDVDVLFEVFDVCIYFDDLVQMVWDCEDYFVGCMFIYCNEYCVLVCDGSWKWVLSCGMVIVCDVEGWLL